jgi:hypothetical protein
VRAVPPPLPPCRAPRPQHGGIVRRKRCAANGEVRGLPRRVAEGSVKAGRRPPAGGAFTARRPPCGQQTCRSTSGAPLARSVAPHGLTPPSVQSPPAAQLRHTVDPFGAGIPQAHEAKAFPSTPLRALDALTPPKALPLTEGGAAPHALHGRLNGAEGVGEALLPCSRAASGRTSPGGRLPARAVGGPRRPGDHGEQFGRGQLRRPGLRNTGSAVRATAHDITPRPLWW